MKVEKEVEMYGYLQSSYEQDLEVVKAKLAEEGITYYSTYKANHCVGVSYVQID
jgi:hypothetical protein